MKIIAQIFIILFVTLMAAVVLLQFDEDLLPQVTSALADYEERLNTDSEAFYYLMGISAAEHEDVITVGREIYGDFLIFEENHSIVDGVTIAVPDARPDRLKTPKWPEPINCNVGTRSCLVTLMESRSKWADNLEPWNEVQERYLTFIQYDEYNSLTKPSAHEIWPEYRFLSIGNRLRILDLLLEASSGRPEQAWSELIDDTARLRVQLRVGDLLLHKMVIARLIANNLEALIFIKSNYLPAYIVTLPTLSGDELSFDLVVARGLQTSVSLNTAMDRRPDMFRLGGNLPAWLVRMTFKPNMTINQAYPAFAELNRLYRLPPDKFAQQASEVNIENYSDFRLTNTMGSAIASIGPSDLRRYKADLHDLNVKINIFNFLISNANVELINPYYPDITVDIPASGELCLDGPYPDKTKRRCINIDPQPASIN